MLRVPSLALAVRTLCCLAFVTLASCETTEPPKKKRPAPPPPPGSDLSARPWSQPEKPWESGTPFGMPGSL